MKLPAYHFSPSSRVAISSSISGSSQGLVENISASINFLRSFFGNGSHLKGCCGPFCELLYHDLAKSSQIDMDLYQLGDTLPGNRQRHAVMIARNKSNPAEAYLIDATIKQFDHSDGKAPRHPHPIQPYDHFPAIAQQGINELRSQGFSKATPELAMAYSSCFHCPNAGWIFQKGSMNKNSLRSAEELTNHLTSSKFAYLFNNSSSTRSEWIQAANNRYT